MEKHITVLKAKVKAPAFRGKDQDGKTFSLKDFAGRKLVLYFYPKDATPGCTMEACNLKDNYSTLLKKGYAVVGVSADDEKKHKKFKEKYGLPFPLLADVDKEVINAYNVWGRKKYKGKEYEGIIRTTFVIDEKGIIEKVITDVNTKNHTEQILENKN